MGATDKIEHHITLVPGAKVVRKQPYRRPPFQEEILDELLDHMLKNNIIEPSISPWASPLLLVKKRHTNDPRAWRMVIDFRALNAQTIPLTSRFANLDTCLDNICNKGIPFMFSTLDCKEGYHQINLDESSRDLTAFSHRTGHFQYSKMAQGLAGAPSTFQRLMDSLFRGQQFYYLLTFLDDLLCVSSTFTDHVEHLRKILQTLKEAGLKLSPQKVNIGQSQVMFLGHHLTREGYKPSSDNIQAIVTYPEPSTVKQIRQFIGMATFYRKFVRDFALIARPLYDLTKVDVPFQWGKSQQVAFDTLKDKLCSMPVLQYPSFSKVMRLETDASGLSIGSILSQPDDEGKNHPVAYAGRGLTPAEKNYDVTGRELLAVVWSYVHFRVYLEGREFELVTDHSALKYMMGLKNPSPKYARWILLLQGAKYKLMIRPGKANSGPDALSRREYKYTKTDADDILNDFPPEIPGIPAGDCDSEVVVTNGNHEQFVGQVIRDVDDHESDNQSSVPLILETPSLNRNNPMNLLDKVVEQTGTVQCPADVKGEDKQVVEGQGVTATLEVPPQEQEDPNIPLPPHDMSIKDTDIFYDLWVEHMVENDGTFLYLSDHTGGHISEGMSLEQIIECDVLPAMFNEEEQSCYIAPVITRAQAREASVPDDNQNSEVNDDPLDLPEEMGPASQKPDNEPRSEADMSIPNMDLANLPRPLEPIQEEPLDPGDNDGGTNDVDPP